MKFSGSESKSPEADGKQAVRLFCRFCGHEVKADAMFCPCCGSRLRDLDAGENEPELGDDSMIPESGIPDPVLLGTVKAPDGWEDLEPPEDEYPAGNAKCERLREIRQRIAEANGIDFTPAECRHTGPCAGTCPVCDEEIRYLDEQLEQKRARGEEIQLSGLVREAIDPSCGGMVPDPAEMKDVLSGVPAMEYPVKEDPEEQPGLLDRIIKKFKKSDR